MSDQDFPIEDGALDASRDEQLRGIVTQVRADLELYVTQDPELLLGQRLADAGLEVGDAEFDELVYEIRRGNPEDDLGPGTSIEQPE